MLNCVYDAWMHHMIHLGVTPGMFSWELYLLIRQGMGNGEGATYGGLVPGLIRALSGIYGCSVRVQHKLWTPEMYIADIRSGKSGLSNGAYRALNMVRDTRDEGMFGSEVKMITIQPAIYLLLNCSHAVFSQEVPKGGPVMALQVYRP